MRLIENQRRKVLKMLSILIKERNVFWQRILAETAERFTAMNARESSGFHLTLSENISEELEKRSGLFVENCDDAEESRAFSKFFENEERGLRETVSSRFGIEVPGKDICNNIREKYIEILVLQFQQKPKKDIGFHT